MSSFMLVRSPRRTIGSVSTHCLFPWHAMADFRERCQRSTSPFEAGWYAVVRILSQPMRLVSAWKNFDSNCAPRSVVTVVGDPYRATHVAKNAVATVSAVVSGIGVAISCICLLLLDSIDSFGIREAVLSGRCGHV